VTRNHIALVMEVSTPAEDGLHQVEDVDVKDKQNFAAVQRLAFPRVRRCLQDIQEGKREGDSFIQEDVRGTVLHLEVLGSFLDIFYGLGTLWERIRLASFVEHILYMGTSYIEVVGHGHSLKVNWLTRECLTDFLISCHFAVNLIRLFRDHFPGLPVALDRAGSDCVEDIFSDFGSQVTNKHNYTLGEAKERASHIVRRGEIKVDPDAPLFAKSRRRANFWLSGCGMTASPNLADYASVSESKCEEAWDAGLEYAQKRAAEVGMRPVLEEKGKWVSPWPGSSVDQQRIEQLMRTDAEDEEEIEAEAPPPPRGEASSVSSEAVLQEDLDEVRLVVLSAAQSQDGEDASDSREEATAGRASNLTRQKVPVKVEVPGVGDVYKNKLIHEMAGSPGKVPLDRLQRVKVRRVQEEGTSSGGGDEVGLFDNIGIWLQEGSEYRWYVAKVQKMFREYDRGVKVDYQRPVSLTDKDGKVKLVCKYYKELESGLFQYGGYGGNENDPVPLTAVIGVLAPLRLDIVSGLYSLLPSDRQVLEDFAAAEAQHLQAQRVTRTRQTSRAQARQAMETEHAVVAEGQPVRASVATRTGRRATTFVRN
jgi:hypothetical protein